MRGRITLPEIGPRNQRQKTGVMNSSASRWSFLSCVARGLSSAVLVALCSCSPGGDPALCGKWQAKDDPKHIIEIRANGTWVEGEKDPDITGIKWTWDGTNHILITAHSKLVGQASGRMKVVLTGNTLTLSDSDGATEYARVK